MERRVRHLLGALLPAPIILCIAATVARAETNAVQQATIEPCDARIREQGRVLDGGAYSFWDDGLLGDWFIADADGELTLAIEARGVTAAGAAPLVAIETISPQGVVKEIARISIDAKENRVFTVKAPIAKGLFALRLHQLNRTADAEKKLLRHLTVARFTVTGARRSEMDATAWLLWGDERPERTTNMAGRNRIVETKSLRLEIDPATAIWSVTRKDSGDLIGDARPVFSIAELPIDLGECRSAIEIGDDASTPIGDATKIALRFDKTGAFEIRYTLWVSKTNDELLAQTDFHNLTGKPLVIDWIASLAAARATLGGAASEWTAISDARSNGEWYQLLRLGGAENLAGWWYLALKNQQTRRSILLGNLSNNKGSGRFHLAPGNGGRTSLSAAENRPAQSDASGGLENPPSVVDLNKARGGLGNPPSVAAAAPADSVKLAAYNDYERIVMPPDAWIHGEKVLLHFGRRGNDSLERLGDLIAAEHKIDLRRDHPLDPDNLALVSIFTAWNGWGASVIEGFPYSHDASKYAGPSLDPEWKKRNQAKVLDYGLDDYGYASRGPTGVVGAVTPLARNYGHPHDKPSYRIKQPFELQAQHPECYVNDRLDFSHPAAQEYERKRVVESFAKAGDNIVRYSWDFTNRWQKLEGQHDPFMTSAETYRIAMGIWRDAGRRHPKGAYGLVWMNVVGFNYDRVDVIHIGADSDHGYYPCRCCSFCQGLVRQISGRYFYNGKVWWNSSDSYHVFAGGMYSYEQAKVHASMCSISGNLVHMGEPFCDQDIPPDRLDMIRRVAPTTPDVAVACDVFEHNPARLWNLPIKRPFGEWNVVGLFNFDMDQQGTTITQTIDLERDLQLAPDREYLVYEFWSRRLLGTVRGSFARTLAAPDCEVYCVVEKTDHPIVVSTNRHVRQLAYDVRELKWDATARTLAGVSRVVRNDPYELRIFAPAGFSPKGAEADGLAAKTTRDSELALVSFTSPESRDVKWKVAF